MAEDELLAPCHRKEVRLLHAQAQCPLCPRSFSIHKADSSMLCRWSE